MKSFKRVVYLAIFVSLVLFLMGNCTSLKAEEAEVEVTETEDSNMDEILDMLGYKITIEEQETFNVGNLNEYQPEDSCEIKLYFNYDSESGKSSYEVFFGEGIPDSVKKCRKKNYNTKLEFKEWKKDVVEDYFNALVESAGKELKNSTEEETTILDFFWNLFKINWIEYIVFGIALVIVLGKFLPAIKSVKTHLWDFHRFLHRKKNTPENKLSKKIEDLAKKGQIDNDVINVSVAKVILVEFMNLENAEKLNLSKEGKKLLKVLGDSNPGFVKMLLPNGSYSKEK